MDEKGDVLSARLKLRTSQREVVEMLIVARGIVADAPCQLPATENIASLDSMAKSQGAKAARNIVNVLRMKAIRMKSGQRALIRNVMPVTLFRILLVCFSQVMVECA